jgi:hypothetical protein
MAQANSGDADQSLEAGMNRTASVQGVWGKVEVAAKGTWIGSALLSNAADAQEKEHALATAMDLAVANANKKPAKVSQLGSWAVLQACI